MGITACLRFAVGAAAFSALLGPGPTYAGKSIPSSLEGVSVGVQRYEWREFADDGFKLLTERGTRVTLGIEEHNLHRRYPGLIFHMDANAWVGNVVYSGHTYNSANATLVPITTSTDYLGGSAAASVGQRYGYISRTQILDLVAGVQVDAWLRNLRSGYNELGEYAAGYRELYRIWTLKAAAALWQPFGRGRGHLQVGAKYPFHTTELISNPRVILSPGKQLSFFGRLEINNLLPLHRRRVVLVLYYDSYRFSPSAVRANVYQPESHMDVFGLSLVLY